MVKLNQAYTMSTIRNYQSQHLWPRKVISRQLESSTWLLLTTIRSLSKVGSSKVRKLWLIGFKVIKTYSGTPLKMEANSMEFKETNLIAMQDLSIRVRHQSMEIYLLRSNWWVVLLHQHPLFKAKRISKSRFSLKSL